MRACGTCTLCCKLMPVAALDKPAGVWCRHAVPGKGCAIHGAHPEPCRIWQCGWIQMEGLDEAWRPDRCGFLLRAEGPDRLAVDVEPSRPDAWRKAPFHAQIRAWAAQVRSGPRHVVVYCAGNVTALFPEGDLELGQTARGDVLIVGYEAAGLMRRPYARLRRADGTETHVAGPPQLA